MAPRPIMLAFLADCWRKSSRPNIATDITYCYPFKVLKHDIGTGNHTFLGLSHLLQRSKSSSHHPSTQLVSHDYQI